MTEPLRRIAAGLLGLALVVAGCSPAPIPSATTVAAASSGATATSSIGTITWCAITLGDGATAEPGVRPSAPPADLPLRLLAPGDAIYGVAFPASRNPRPPLFAVAGAHARCTVHEGTGLVWSIEDAGTTVFSYDESWSTDPPKRNGCPYLQTARTAYVAAIAAATVPPECAPEVGSHVVPIPAEASGLELALVTSGTPASPPQEARLYGYRPTDAPGGELGFVARCSAAGDGASRCRTALAFVAARIGGGFAASDAVATVFPVGSPRPGAS